MLQGAVTGWIRRAAWLLGRRLFGEVLAQHLAQRSLSFLGPERTLQDLLRRGDLVPG